MSNYYGSNGYPVPTGTILPMVVTAPNQIPESFLYCDGTQYEKKAYYQLYAVIGDSYNVGGETAGYFRVPNLVQFPYIGYGAPATNNDPTFPISKSIVTANLPPMVPADFTVSACDVTITTPSLYPRTGGVTSSDGGGAKVVKSDSSDVTGFDPIVATGGSFVSYVPPVAPVPAEGVFTGDDIFVGGYRLVHCIKARQQPYFPQSALPPLLGQFPDPQYLYQDCDLLSGTIVFPNAV